MLLFKMLLVLGVATWLVISTGCRIWRAEFGRGWRISFVLVTLCGLGLGIWFLNVRYLVSPKGLAYGIPFVIAGGDLIDGRWLVGGVGRFLILAILADVSVGMAACLLPLAIAARIWDLRKKRL